MNADKIKFSKEEDKLTLYKKNQWLPTEMKKEIDKHLNLLDIEKEWSIKNDSERYFYLLSMFERCSAVFINQTMKEMWNKLYQLSPYGAALFVRKLLRMEWEYNMHLAFIEKDKWELNNINSIISSLSDAVNKIDDDQKKLCGNIIHGNHTQDKEKLNEMIKRYIKGRDNLKKKLEKESYYSNEYYPVTRQKKAKNVLPIYFMRKIHTYFTKNFDKPMYSIIADIVNCIFNTQYDDSEVVQYVRYIKKIKKQ